MALATYNKGSKGTNRRNADARRDAAGGRDDNRSKSRSDVSRSNSKRIPRKVGRTRGPGCRIKDRTFVARKRVRKVRKTRTAVANTCSAAMCAISCAPAANNGGIRGRG